MRIIQIINELIYGHAVSNHAIAIKELLNEAGIASEIYCEKISDKLPEKLAKTIEKMPQLYGDDIIIYHLRVKTELNRKVAALPGKKILIYHVLTPASFARKYDKNGEINYKEGLKEVLDLLQYTDMAFEPSDFDCNELKAMGFPEEKIVMVPYLLQLDDLLQKPDSTTVDRCKDGKTNILFVSRIVPNKKQEDAIAAFAYYKKHINMNSRLILPGMVIFNKYKEQLDRYITALGLSSDDVWLPGSIPFNQILAYYATADLFLCSSEHEGFCIPLVEAMCFDIPIIAYRFTAIPDTLDGSGILLDKKDPVLTALCIQRVLEDDNLRNELVKKQREILVNYQYQRAAVKFLYALQNFISVHIQNGRDKEEKNSKILDCIYKLSNKQTDFKV